MEARGRRSCPTAATSSSTTRAADDARGVYVGSLGSQTTKLVLPGDFGAVFAAPDYLLFARDEGLVFAQHFDLDAPGSDG